MTPSLSAPAATCPSYLEVTGIDSLWPHVSQFKDRHKIRDLFDRDYGMREFHILEPDDCLIFVGEEIQKQ